MNPQSNFQTGIETRHFDPKITIATAKEKDDVLRSNREYHIKNGNVYEQTGYPYFGAGYYINPVSCKRFGNDSVPIGIGMTIT